MLGSGKSRKWGFMVWDRGWERKYNSRPSNFLCRPVKTIPLEQKKKLSLNERESEYGDCDSTIKKWSTFPTPADTKRGSGAEGGLRMMKSAFKELSDFALEQVTKLSYYVALFFKIILKFIYN